MPVTKSPRPKGQFHQQAYLFVRDALQESQQQFVGDRRIKSGDHISPRELLEGVRSLGQRRFGMMAITVLRYWGISTTTDIGRIVFELIELGEMKKTENDQFSDFVDVFSFEEVFDNGYVIDISKAFQN